MMSIIDLLRDKYNAYVEANREHPTVLRMNTRDAAEYCADLDELEFTRPWGPRTERVALYLARPMGRLHYLRASGPVDDAAAEPVFE